MKYYCYWCIVHCFLVIAPKGEPCFLWSEETNLLIFYLRNSTLLLSPASTEWRECVGLRQGVQILNSRDRGAKCDQRHLLSQALQQEWLQRSPAEVNFHLKNMQLFLKLRHFVRMCQSGHNFQQESQSESFGGFCFVLIMVKCLVLTETELLFL